MLHRDVAFIIGNGVSRKPFNLYSLVGVAPIFGCNALYREFPLWNYLVAIDDGMIKEIETYHMNKGMVIIPPEDERWESAEYSKHRRRSNAGMNAMEEAIRRGAKTLYCLGFDFFLEGDISTDNIFKGTNNYGPETHAREEDNQYRINYFNWYTRKHSDVEFIIVVPESPAVKPSGYSNNVHLYKQEQLKNLLFAIKEIDGVFKDV